MHASLFGRFMSMMFCIAALAAGDGSAKADDGSHKGPWQSWSVAECRRIQRTAEGVATCIDGRKEIVSALEEMERQPVDADYLLPFDPPDNWWGIDPLAANRLADSGAHFEYLISPDRHLIIHVFYVDSPHGEAWVDAFSGSSLNSNDQISDLRPVMRKIGTLDLQMRPSATIPLTKEATLFVDWRSCGGPDSFAGSYWHNMLEHGWHDILGTPKLYRRFDTPTQTYFRGLCEEVASAPFVASFRPLAIGFLGLFPDRTILAVAFDENEATAGDLLLIRYRLDLTSAFFNGRSDLVMLYPPDFPATATFPSWGDREYIASLAKVLAIDATIQRNENR